MTLDGPGAPAAAKRAARSSLAVTTPSRRRAAHRSARSTASASGRRSGAGEPALGARGLPEVLVDVVDHRAAARARQPERRGQQLGVVDVVEVGVARGGPRGRGAIRRPGGARAAIGVAGAPTQARGARAGGGAGLLVEDAHVARAVDAGEVDDPPPVAAAPPSAGAAAAPGRAEASRRARRARPAAGPRARRSRGRGRRRGRCCATAGPPGPRTRARARAPPAPASRAPAASRPRCEWSVVSITASGSSRQARRALLADQVGAEGAGDPRGEARAPR